MFATNGCQEISLQMLFLESNKNFRSIVTKYIYIYTHVTKRILILEKFTTFYKSFYKLRLYTSYVMISTCHTCPLELFLN